MDKITLIDDIINFILSLYFINIICLIFKIYLMSELIPFTNLSQTIYILLIGWNHWFIFSDDIATIFLIMIFYCWLVEYFTITTNLLTYMIIITIIMYHLSSRQIIPYLKKYLSDCIINNFNYIFAVNN